VGVGHTAHDQAAVAHLLVAADRRDGLVDVGQAVLAQVLHGQDAVDFGEPVAAAPQLVQLTHVVHPLL